MSLQTTSSEPIRIAIAGLGRSGWRNHALRLAELSNLYRVVAVADADPARCNEAKEKFGCRVYSSVDALVGDRETELVTVATLSHLHLQHVTAALAAGKHVVCEKPMAASVDEVDQMIAAAHKAQKVLTVFQNRRFSADFRQVRRVIDSGQLGRIVQVRIAIHTYGRRWDWQTLKAFNGGELSNTASHFIDQALLLLGPGEPQVFYHSDRALTCGDAEDHCKIVLRVPGRPLVEVEVSYACASPQSKFLVMGTSGTLTGGGDSLTWRTSNVASLPPRQADPRPTPDRGYNDEPLEWQEHAWQPAADEPGESVVFYGELFKSLRNGAPLAVTPESVRRQIQVLDACRTLSPV